VRRDGPSGRLTQEEEEEDIGIEADGCAVMTINN